MYERAEAYISQATAKKSMHNGVRQIITISALLVALAVFWCLKLTGITIAGDAFCGIPEHIHNQECPADCTRQIHIHTANCYSDLRADVETAADWKLTMAELVPNGVTSDQVVAIARSQLGYQESTRHFFVDADGVRRGITRYGQWYGNPYGDWSAMFVAFCLHYAGIDSVPTNGGPMAMQMEWENAGLYRDAMCYTPQVGDVLFLEKESDRVDAVAVIAAFDGETITVVEGDWNDRVAENTYSVHDPAVRGYGLVPKRSEPTIIPLAESGEPVAQKVTYQESLLTAENNFVLYTQQDGVYYAFDGSGNAVPITIDADGNIFTDLADPDLLLWNFSGSNSNYTIRNLSTGRYMHAYPNNGSGVTTAGAYSSTIVTSGDGIKIRSNSEYARLDVDTNTFVMTQNVNLAATYQIGMTSRCVVWLDGTAGGQGQLGGSEDKSYSVEVGAQFRLPESWLSPDKYQQKLRGWYDVTNQRYYAPGTEITVTGNMVFYADWVAATYDIGKYNAHVSDTISTQSFITTHVFDYNYLFNVLSANPTISVDASSHKETWSMVQNGTVDFNGQESLGFVFVDYDGSSRLSDMANRDNNNNYRGAGVVTPGIYTPELGEILFGTDNALDPTTGQGVIGKTYLGTGDHLFQFMTDPNDEHYGYYYYDSQRNAASYNQSAQRFFVYNYLEATSDSLNSSVMSDFLPFNSPYANNNGKEIRTYTYAGDNGEYAGINHYRYDAKYSDSNNNPAYVATNYAFGLKIDVNFYLPTRPGEVDAVGQTGNKDIFGNDMHFQFQGDDDVWILVNGMLVLDIGGIHGIEGGDVNFSTGVVTVNGEVDEALSEALKTVTAGEHTLTIMYLERGSSQSNSAFYFNLAPRYSLTLQKEDVLTQQLLNGAEFSVYTDEACTKPARLYTSEEAYHAGEVARNTFTIVDGKTHMWGLAAGGTYYIRETKGPDVEGYGCADGLIRLVIDKDGIATYHVSVLPESDSTVPSKGFTVHGISIDEETQSAFLVITNAPETVTETTTVQVYKKWEDTLDHSADYIAAYLTVKDPDGTVRRIREVLLSAENNWMYTWTNLPKYDYDQMVEVQYGIEESYESGYYSTVRKVTVIVLETTTWAEAVEFMNGQTYVLKTTNGCLSTLGAGSDTGFKWVTEETARTSIYALWTAHVSGSNVKLTNAAGQTITFYYNNGRPSDFYASTSGESTAAKQYFCVASTSTGLRLYYDAPNNRDYYITSTLNSSNKLGYSTSSRNGMIITPMTKITETDVVEVEDWAYQVINTPLAKENETSLQVQKLWDLGMAGEISDYEQAQVTVKLFANGVDTGRIVTLSLKNNWTSAFLGLPYKDAEGNVIVYTVQESWQNTQWKDSYGPIQTMDGQPPSYSTTITNTHVSVGGPELPGTGSAARLIYVLCGGAIMLASLVYGIIVRRKRERGNE